MLDTNTRGRAIVHGRR